MRVFAKDSSQIFRPLAILAMLCLAVPASGRVWRVEAERAADAPSIQAAIDRAAPGDIIEVGPGVYRETLVIDRPVRIEGAGAARTVIRPARYLPREQSGIGERLTERLERAESFEREQQLIDNLVRQYASPVVTVEPETEAVELAGLKLSGVADGDAGHTFGPVARVWPGSELALFDVVVAGGRKGIELAGDGLLHLEHCLVAGFWLTGIDVEAAEGEQARVELFDTEVRHCRYTGATLSGPGVDALIDHCTFAVSAWHGLRYDDCAPIVRDSRFEGSERSGIYASGATTATLTGNLLIGQGIDGISCWYANADTIENNIFVENGEAGLSILGGSQPRVLANRFISNPVGIRFLALEGDAPGSALPDPLRPIVAGNLFTGNGPAAGIDSGKGAGLQSAPGLVLAGNRIEPADADALRAELNRFAAPGTPWPMQPEEEAIAPPEGEAGEEQWGEPYWAREPVF